MPLRIGGRLQAKPELRFGMDEWVSLVNQSMYDPMLLQQTIVPAGQAREPVRPQNFVGNANLNQTNGSVFALMAFRLRLFSQVRWSYQQFNKGKPGDLFSLPSLDVLNTDPRLNAQMIQDVDLAGNSYHVLQDGQIWRLRPDWVQAVGDGPLNNYDTTILGYAFFTGGYGNCAPEDAKFFPAADVAHWMPQPDPLAWWRGMSWLTPVVREVQADSAASVHRQLSYENGATPNMIIKYDPSTSLENFLKAKQHFTEEYEGLRNVGKTLHLGGGADATVVGQTFQQLDFTNVQGAGETRLASAAGIHPVVVGFSEGMKGASLNAGNYGMARRSTAEGTFHPLWVSAAATLASILTPPVGSRMWYDPRHIPFLREDAADDAAIKAQEAQTIRTLTDAGFEPGTVVAAVMAGDWTLLKHDGLFSVQLQPPGMTTSTPSQSTNTSNLPGRSFHIVRDEHHAIKDVEVV